MLSRVLIHVAKVFSFEFPRMSEPIGARARSESTAGVKNLSSVWQCRWLVERQFFKPVVA
jgi:hypothetical protein